MEAKKFKTLDEVKKEYVAYVVFHCDTLTEAAYELKVTYKTLYNLMKEIGITKDKERKTYYHSKNIAEKFPKIIEKDYACTPNLTPKEWEYLKNRTYNCKIPDNISSSLKKK